MPFFILINCYVFYGQKSTISRFIHQNYPKDHLQLFNMVCFVEKRTLGTFFTLPPHNGGTSCMNLSNNTRSFVDTHSTTTSNMTSIVWQKSDVSKQAELSLHANDWSIAMFIRTTSKLSWSTAVLKLNSNKPHHRPFKWIGGDKSWSD